LKRIFIAFALCLVSFQSYAESEMTFKEFGDVVYSEDQSAYFVRYTDTTVKKQKRGKALRYSAGKYGDYETQFQDACLAKCALRGQSDGKKGCGGVVFVYHDSNKNLPVKCTFKTLEPKTKKNKKKKHDFYKRICYEGGPFTFPDPDPKSEANGNCKMFGKIELKRADGAIVAPTTCNDGDPYTKANDQACQDAGQTACWGKGSSSDTQFSPWVVGTRSSKLFNAEFDDCFRVCAINNLCYQNAPPLIGAASFQKCWTGGTLKEGSPELSLVLTTTHRKEGQCL
jgi:hypothetical protein